MISTRTTYSPISSGGLPTEAGAQALSQVQYVFLELPKYRAGDDPRGLIDHWAYFFREAENLDVVPAALAGPPFSEALEVARIANFTAEELEVYDQAKIAEQDARGALSLAESHGREEPSTWRAGGARSPGYSGQARGFLFLGS